MLSEFQDGHILKKQEMLLRFLMRTAILEQMSKQVLLQIGRDTCILEVQVVMKIACKYLFLVGSLLLVTFGCGSVNNPVSDKNSCVDSGEYYSGKVEYRECCEGLTSVAPIDVIPPEERNPEYEGRWIYMCKLSEAPGVQTCIPCGDGVCQEELENGCMCPEDCGEPE